MPKDKKVKQPMKNVENRELILKRFDELVMAKINPKVIKKNTDKIREKLHKEEEKIFKKPLVKPVKIDCCQKCYKKTKKLQKFTGFILPTLFGFGDFILCPACARELTIHQEILFQRFCEVEKKAYDEAIESMRFKLLDSLIRFQNESLKVSMDDFYKICRQAVFDSMVESANFNHKMSERKKSN